MTSRRHIREEQLRRVDLYPVISGTPFNAGRPDQDILDGVLEGGVRMVQYRPKEICTRDALLAARIFRTRTEQAQALLVVNDRLDIALACGADGVHLGQQDLPVSVARSLAPDLIIGASTHSLEQALLAQEQGASYVNIGPIFPTNTKERLTTFLGPGVISDIARHLSIPFTVMGGIKEHHVPQLMAAGARILAVVTAVSQAEDVTAAAVRFRRAMGNVAAPGGEQP